MSFFALGVLALLVAILSQKEIAFHLEVVEEFRSLLASEFLSYLDARLQVSFFQQQKKAPKNAAPTIALFHC